MRIFLSFCLGLLLQYSTFAKPADEDTSRYLTYAYSTGIRINYERIGHGYKKIVLIDGFETSLHIWDDLVGLFPKDEFTLFILDLKGIEKSSELPKTNNILQEQTDIVVQFIKDINADTLYLIGHSTGGTVAVLTLITLINENNNPGISKLILIDCKENIAYSFIATNIKIDQTEYDKIIDGCGSIPQEEKPHVTFEKIYSFIGRH